MEDGGKQEKEKNTQTNKRIVVNMCKFLPNNNCLCQKISHPFLVV